jgi:hypothetical protein
VTDGAKACLKEDKYQKVLVLPGQIMKSLRKEYQESAELRNISGIIFE